jgi:hypothetical protein
MLKLLDIFLTFLHLAIISFNLFGWIWKPFRKAHLICVILTAASWLILGIWFGLGYCPITEWQWNVKSKLGETNLPNSFIKYYADKIFQIDFDASLIDKITAGSFLIAAFLSVYYNFIKGRK